MSILGTLGHVAGAVAGTAFDYATPGKGSSRLTDSSYAALNPIPSGIHIDNTPAPASTSGVNTSELVDSSSNLTARTNALLAQIAQMNQKVYAPALDYNSINSQARSSAEQAVNPYYDKLLNDFLKSQATAKAQTEAQTATNISNLQDTLKNTIEGNTITGARTAEDTATNLGQINTAADQFQTDSGQKFATDRVAKAEALSKAGLTGGLGAQQTEADQTARNTTEKRQEQTFQTQRNTQELSKARTFEDLSRSTSMATGTEAKGEKQANVDLGNFIENQGLDLTGEQNKLAASKEADIISKTASVRGGLVQSFINSISNPAQRQAALSAYGSLL